MQNKKVIYISGPMTGYDDFNRLEFNKAAMRLSKNHNVLNPATLPDGLSQLQYMSICQPMVMCADCIYMLKGWENSTGAITERALAIKIGLNVELE